MVDYQLQDYWTFVYSFLHGDDSVLPFLESMAMENDRAGRAAHRFVCYNKDVRDASG